MYHARGLMFDCLWYFYWILNRYSIVAPFEQHMRVLVSSHLWKAKDYQQTKYR